MTSRYFARMGLAAAYWMAPGSRAPLAMYREPGELLGEMGLFAADGHRTTTAVAVAETDVEYNPLPQTAAR